MAGMGGGRAWGNKGCRHGRRVCKGQMNMCILLLHIITGTIQRTCDNDQVYLVFASKKYNALYCHIMSPDLVRLLPLDLG